MPIYTLYWICFNCSENCLLNPGNIYNKAEYEEHTKKLPGEFHNVDAQCKLIQGENSKMCEVRSSEPVYQFILPPGQLAPPPPPEDKLFQEILSPLVIFTQGGASCPGRLMLTPSAHSPNTSKNLTCHFVTFLYHFNKFRSSIKFIPVGLI